MRRNRQAIHRVLLGSILAAIALIALLAMAAGADAATVGPFELSGGTLPAVQVPSLLGFRSEIVKHPAGAAYGAGGRGAPASASTLTITKKLDQTSAALQKAVISGGHYKLGSLIFQTEGSSYEAICMTDAYPISYQAGSNAGSSIPEETVSIAYAKVSFHYGQGANCSGTPTPPVESTLVGINRSASKLTARLDCLTSRCRGIFDVSLPSAACPAGASTAGPSRCSYTGPTRVGLHGGTVKFNSDGTAFTGGVKVGISGAGSFSMGDGSVRVLQLPVPSPLRKWLKGHSHASLGSIIVVRGLGKAIVEHELIDAPAKIYAAIPDVTASEPPPPSNPPVQPQSLLITECSKPVVGTPTVIAVSGTLSPARGGATVSLTYTPVNGPLPLPAPIVDQVTTTATGSFGENFDRQQNGKPYSWEVVASITEGGGYAAASSPPCAVPIP